MMRDGRQHAGGRINKLAPPGVNLFVKIEAFNPLGSVKDRLALGVIEAAGARAS
jgi:cysteine synthase